MISLSATTLASGAQASTINLGYGHDPAISSDGQGHLFVVFEGTNSNSGTTDIYYSSSDDGGQTWTKRLDVSPTSGVSAHPRVAIEKGGAIDVVWTDTVSGENSPDIFFTRSTDGGRTWSKPIDITNTLTVSREPVLAVGQDNTIHVAFTDHGREERSKDVFYTSSSDGGKTWSTERRVENVSNTSGDSSEPAIAVDTDGVVHIAWQDDSPGNPNPQIYYSQRTPSGWAKPESVSNSRRYSYHPVIACESGRTNITWSDRTGLESAADIWCTVSAKHGPFSHPIRITGSGSIASEAAMAAGRTDRVAIVWPDRALGMRNPRIRLRVLSEDPIFAYRGMKLSKSSALAMAPEVVIDGNSLTAVWEERKGYDRNSSIKVRSVTFKDLPTRRKE